MGASASPKPALALRAEPQEGLDATRFDPARGLGCYDCGLPYDDAWVEAVVSRGDWELISPTGGEGGILCIGCIARRAHARGFRRLPVLLTAGPLATPTAAETQFIVGSNRQPRDSDRNPEGAETAHTGSVAAGDRARAEGIAQSGGD